MQVAYPCLISEDGIGLYMAIFPDLPGCMTDGISIVDTIAHASEALHGCVETMMDYNLKIPEPSKLNDITIQEGTRLVWIHIDI